MTPGDAYYVLVPYTRKINKILAENYKERSEKQYFIGSHIDEFRLTDKKLRYWTTEGITRGSLNSVDRDRDVYKRQAVNTSTSLKCW